MSYIFRWLPGQTTIPDEAWAEVVEYIRRTKEVNDGDRREEGPDQAGDPI